MTRAAAGEALRLFIAIELTDAARAELARIIESARREDRDGAYRWVNPALLHVTLHFLGSTPASLVPSIEAALGRAAAAVEPFPLRLSEAGSFGAARAPRILWVGFDKPADPLVRLHQGIGAELRTAGLAVEARPLAPHVTVARRRDRSPRDAAVPWPRPVVSTELDVAHVALVQSTLLSDGPEYSALLRAPLGRRLSDS
ncbi:MAG: RNA 2',3'-cyclic phosphodiesterase [Chloroflexi bacterium]|nr:RNA 2',3'-cyclic phosphodiesterase [Chloroflexota bacterium]